ncbi:MAG: hypothetical protein CM1200mP30_08820 [Pseudomonadota bacterium]|nr:MAG: hypothetical protein CM1200mP30_08820 [Pseudomonadota bacterium]
MKSANIIVVGGGIIGVSLAYGMAEQGEKVTVIDNGKGVNNASRGNFGLVWVQGKGAGCLVMLNGLWKLLKNGRPFWKNWGEIWNCN